MAPLLIGPAPLAVLLSSPLTMTPEEQADVFLPEKSAQEDIKHCQ